MTFPPCTHQSHTICLCLELLHLYTTQFNRRNGSNRYTHIKIISGKGYFIDTINPGGDNLYTADQICRMVEFLIDNIFVKFGGCLDHKILTEKMSSLGFAESTIRWYKSYLTNRCFIVNVGNDFSFPGKLLCGVPQGSISGPLLFLLYVNDMPQAVNSDLLLYADDTCLIYTAKDINTIEEQLNTDFSSL